MRSDPLEQAKETETQPASNAPPSALDESLQESAQQREEMAENAENQTVSSDPDVADEVLAEAAGTVEAVLEAAAREAAVEDLPLSCEAQLQAEMEKWKDVSLRSQAELDNFRKRMARERADAVKYGNTALLEGLLPILDNFCFGLEAAKRESAESVVFQGMSMVYKQFHDFLEEQGVKEVVAEGKAFDPNFHDAVKQEVSESVPEGQILAVIRRGYQLNERLLRPASVVVAVAAQAAAEEVQATAAVNHENQA